jgi:hypothetical protein
MVAVPFIVNEFSAEQLVDFPEGTIFCPVHCDFDIVIPTYDPVKKITVSSTKGCTVHPIGLNFIESPGDLICRFTQIDLNGLSSPGDFIVSLVFAVHTILIAAEIANAES